MMIAQPLQVADRLGQFDVVATVEGSGLSGQAGAIRHGISKALTYYEPGLRAVLKPHGFLTRDSRIVERKKYGKAKARRSFPVLQALVSGCNPIAPPRRRSDMNSVASSPRRRDLFAAPLVLSLPALAAVGPALAATDPYATSPWRRLTDADWRRRLSAPAYEVLRHEHTETSGTSPLLAEHRKGVFACGGCGLPLFNSAWKFESGTGWPSFYTAIRGAVAKKADLSLGMDRTEYHCARCLGHQGHILRRRPAPHGPALLQQRRRAEIHSRRKRGRTPTVPQASSASASAHKRRVISAACSTRARAADCPAQACIPSTSPVLAAAGAHGRGEARAEQGRGAGVGAPGAAAARA